MGKRANGEGSVYKQRNGLWAASLTTEDGKRKYFYGKTRKEASDKLTKALNDRKDGALVATPKQTLEQFLRDWLEHSQKQSVRERTFERYEEIVRLHVIPVLGRHQLQKLSPQHLQAFYTKKLQEGLSPTTVTTIHNVLHKALDTAFKWGLVNKNVSKLVSPPRRERFEGHPLTLDQIQTLLEVAKGHSMEALLKLALATGMRRGELMGLKWQDIDFSSGVLQVRRVLTRIPSKLEGKGYKESEPKTRKSRRSITVASFALDALKQHRKKQLAIKMKAGASWQEHDYVFCTSIGTNLNPSRDMLDPLKELLESAGLPDIRFHDLRHSTATLLFSFGVHPKVVQELLGHSQISMTLDVYSHMLPSLQADATSRLNDALSFLEDESEETDI
ncbi:site-specific integrase [Dictyobacter alpinus]|uniref:Site-specific integrase n=1 Tax=Dictyobacter alpinus TaxID=2014873 RepID=A0A402BA30_9CHLR|nr:tyrosine-type recombinase/integrase [Dictyobacter alpinus]GCE28149.1 site-specific integrase [Dictyobacter alpinus]